jgi:hypothetical protein
MMRQAYRFFLLLYPREHRDRFAEEMAGVFGALCDEKHGRGWYVRFAFRELAGMVGGAAGAWLDRQPRHVMDAAVSSNEPRDLAEAQQLVQSNIAAMIQAIATHQFERARRLSDEERAARCHLQALRAKYGITN